MTVDQHSFRAVLGRFASGVTVVTTRDKRKRDQGMTVSAFCSVSLDPPLVLICIEHTASLYNTLDKATHFIVNILSDGQEAIARRFAEAKKEIALARTCGVYDHFLVNDDIKDTIGRAVALVQAQRAK